MTGFDRKIANRVAAYLASQDAYMDGPTVVSVSVLLLCYPEIEDIIGHDGFQHPAEAWHWIYERLTAHRLLMGNIMAQLISRRFVLQQEDDGA